MSAFQVLLLIFGLAFVSAKRPYNLSSKDTSRQKLTCYENYNQQGDSVVLSEYTPILENYNFDNRAASCCFEGIWFLYDQEYYNANNPNALAFTDWGENYCLDFDEWFTQVASSARYTGAPDGYKYSTLNLYELTWFAGSDQYFYGDDPSFTKFNAQSAVVTGCDAWTIYE